MGQVGIETPYFWLQLSSIAIVGSACLLISVVLFYMILRIKDLPFKHAYFGVGLFMFMLALTRFSQVVGMWNPDLPLEFVLTTLTAVSGMVAASILFLSVPQILALSQGRREAAIHSMKLEQAYEELLNRVDNLGETTPGNGEKPLEIVE